jgi:hypothetical protein
MKPRVAADPEPTITKEPNGKMRDVSPRSHEEAERIIVDQEALFASFRSLLRQVTDKQRSVIHDVWLGCNNRTAKAEIRFEKLIYAIEDDVRTLTTRVRDLSAEVALLKKMQPPAQPPVQASTPEGGGK